jgi:hypothetical protein
MGYGQVFNPVHLEEAHDARTAATYALRRYFGQQMVEDRFADLIPLAASQLGRNVFEVYTFGDGKTYEKGYTVIIDDVTMMSNEEK